MNKYSEQSIFEVPSHKDPSNLNTVPNQVSDISVYLLSIIIFGYMLTVVSTPFHSLIGKLYLKLIYNLLYKNKINSLRESRIVQTQGTKNLNGFLVENPIGFVTNSIEPQIIEWEAFVKVTVPRLNPSGELEYKELSYNINELETVEPSSLEFAILSPAISVIDQHLSYQNDISLLIKRQAKIADLLRNTVSYNLDENNEAIYRQDLILIEKGIAEIKSLQLEQDRYTKESLIALKIAELETEMIDDRLYFLKEQKQYLEEKRQETKDFVNAYLSLKNNLKIATTHE